MKDQGTNIAAISDVIIWLKQRLGLKTTHSQPTLKAKVCYNDVSVLVSKGQLCDLLKQQKSYRSSFMFYLYRNIYIICL